MGSYKKKQMKMFVRIFDLAGCGRFQFGFTKARCVYHINYCCKLMCVCVCVFVDRFAAKAFRRLRRLFRRRQSSERGSLGPTKTNEQRNS